MKKRILSAMMVCSVTLMTVAGPSAVLADTIDQQIEQQDKKINALQGQQAATQAQIDQLEAEAETVGAQISELEAKQTALSNDTIQLQDKIATLKLRIAKREEAIQKQARDVQVNGNSANFIDAVLNADSLTDAIGRVQAMTTIVNANNDLVQEQKQDKATVEEKVKENETKINEILANQQQLEEQKNTLTANQAELNVLKAGLAAEQATAETDKAKLNKQKEEAEAEKARILKEQQEAAAAEKARVQAEAAAAKEAEQAEIANLSNKTENTDQTTETETAPSTPSSGNTDNSSSAGNAGSTGSTTPNTGGNTSGGSGTDYSSQGNAYAPGQCTWYVKSVAPWAGSYWGNGAQWGASASADGYLVNSTPAAGSIVVFGAGQQVGNWTAHGSYGHVAYVQSYDPSSNTITITQGGTGFSSPMGPNTQTLSASGYVYIHR